MALKINAKGKTAEILLYDNIGEMWGVSAREFSKKVIDLGNNVSRFVMRINSDGGDVFDGVTMHNFLKSHTAKLKASLEIHIDGVAASIASIVAMAADPGKLHMADNAWMMIHSPWGVSIGTAAEMRETADLLDGIQETLVSTYAKRATIKETEIAAMVSKETWFTAKQAKDAGLIDVITDEMKIAASVHKDWFKFTPKQLLQDQVQPPVVNKRVKEILARTEKTLQKFNSAGV